MRENGYITPRRSAGAIAEPLVTQMRPLGIQAEDADYFVEEVRRMLYAKYGEQGPVRRRAAGALDAGFAPAELRGECAARRAGAL